MEVTRVSGSKFTGVCKFWNAVKGFGFISADDGGADLFIAQQDLVTVDGGFRALTAGQRVECEYTVEATKALGKNVTGVNGAPLTSFKDKFCAKRAIEAAKPPDPRKNCGVVKWFDLEKKYGFIVPEVSGNEDVFFHLTECKEGIVPKPGDNVEYQVGVDAKGKTVGSQIKNKTQRRPANAVGGPNMPSPMMPSAMMVRASPAMYDPSYNGAAGPYLNVDPSAYGDANWPQKQQQASQYSALAYGRATGMVKFFNDAKNFGFIVPDAGGREIHVHRTNVIGGKLAKGDAVEFEEEHKPNGKVVAVSVTVVTGGSMFQGKQQQHSAYATPAGFTAQQQQFQPKRARVTYE